MSTFDQLEKFIQHLLEKDLPKYLPGEKYQKKIAGELAAAMKNAARTNEEDKIIAPNIYTLMVNPAVLDTWQSQAALIETLTEILASAAEDTGLRFATPPSISIASNELVPNDEIRVLASHTIENIAETKGITLTEARAEPGESAIPTNAFLIVDGVKVFPLDKQVVNIGRRMDNHLIIDDPRVSRNHVQLRTIKGRYVLFDLNSTGGTFVNGQRTNQTVLYPGDVVSLAGVPLIFGQDNPPPRSDLFDTAPLNLSSSERPTAILDKDKQSAAPKDESTQ